MTKLAEDGSKFAGLRMRSLVPVAWLHLTAEGLKWAWHRPESTGVPMCVLGSVAAMGRQESKTSDRKMAQKTFQHHT